MKPGEVTCIIQARMGSHRLPGKTLALVSGKPLIQHVIERVSASTLVNHLILATSTSSQDDPVAELTQKLGIASFRGSENDVLDRYYQASQLSDTEHLVRINGDCPLMDPEVIDRVIRKYISAEFDYVANILNYPDGLGVEAFSRHALKRAWAEATLGSDREHVTPYIRNSGHFRVSEVRHNVDLSHLKWSVDSQADLEFVRAVNEHLGTEGSEKLFAMGDVIQALEDFPSLALINQVSYRGEGLYHSIANDPPIVATNLNLSRSKALKGRGLNLIPRLTQTERDSIARLAQSAPTVYISRGEGSHIWDVDGNEYIDYPVDFAATPLGHNHPRVTEAVSKQIRYRVNHFLPQKLELELSELLVEIVPYAEMAQFSTSEADAVTGAIGVAKAFTGRNLVVSSDDHHQTIPFQYNDVFSLEQIFDRFPNQVAAVIMEPVGVQEPKDHFLFDVRNLTNRNGALLIFDETITGFRLDLGGAQSQIGVSPDLACFGKSMANGYPISAVAGRREVMELFELANRGDPLSMVAALATVEEIRQSSVIPHLWGQGRKLKDGFNTLARSFEVAEYLQCTGLAPRTVVTFKDKTGAESPSLRTLFQHECLKRGLLFSACHNPGYSHSDQDINHTLRTYRTVVEILGQVIKGNGPIDSRISGLQEPIVGNS